MNGQFCQLNFMYVAVWFVRFVCVCLHVSVCVCVHACVCARVQRDLWHSRLSMFQTGSYDLTSDSMNTFKGKNPSRYSYLVQGHENPYFKPADERRPIWLPLLQTCRWEETRMRTNMAKDQIEKSLTSSNSGYWYILSLYFCWIV